MSKHSFLARELRHHFFLCLIIGGFLSIIVYSLNHHLKNNIRSYAVENPITAPDVNVSAFINGEAFNLFGYTSPRAFVTLTGRGASDFTYADDTGYFAFANTLVAPANKDVCLIAQDQMGRTTAPVCIPRTTDTHINIGPVILPPTISLNQSNYYIGDHVIISGQSLPNTTVSLRLYNDGSKFFNITLPILADIVAKPVEAFGIPQLTAQTDEKGNYAMESPTAKPENFRLFAQSQYKSSDSPKSNTLTFSILPYWMIIIEFLGFLWMLFLKYALNIILLVEIACILIYWLYRRFYGHFSSRALIVSENILPALKEANSLTLPTPHPLLVVEKN